jgi:predicted HicB family RNase H-like nuclease
VELDLSEELVRHLETMAARTGLSLNDLITDLLSRQVDPPA